MAEKPASGVRVMAWPEHGLVAAEGRLSAAVEGTARTTRLASRDELRHAEAHMRRQVRELLGCEPDGGAGEVRRYDLTTERAFTDGAEGLAFLRAMSLMVPGGYKRKNFVAADGRVETTYVVTAKRGRALARAYDKGVESGSHAPGERVRLEAQNRPTKADRMTAEVLATSDLRRSFGRTVTPFLGAEEITVTDPTGLVDVLATKAATGELSMARAERLIGAQLLLQRFGRAIYGDDDKSSRRLRALREAGVLVDHDLPPSATVPVSRLLREMVEEFAA